MVESRVSSCDVRVSSCEVRVSSCGNYSTASDVILHMHRFDSVDVVQDARSNRILTKRGRFSIGVP